MIKNERTIALQQQVPGQNAIVKLVRQRAVCRPLSDRAGIGIQNGGIAIRNDTGQVAIEIRQLSVLIQGEFDTGVRCNIQYVRKQHHCFVSGVRHLVKKTICASHCGAQLNGVPDGDSINIIGFDAKVAGDGEARVCYGQSTAGNDRQIRHGERAGRKIKITGRFQIAGCRCDRRCPADGPVNRHRASRGSGNQIAGKRYLNRVEDALEDIGRSRSDASAVGSE